MATALKLRRGTTAQHSSFTGAEGEITVDTTKDTVVVHDGSTAGGVPLAKESGSAISATNLSYTGTLTGGTGVVNLGSGQFYKDASGNVGIGTSSPLSSGSGLDISSGGFSLVVGANSGTNTRSDATNKLARIVSAHYTNAEEPVILAFVENNSTTNEITFGGGSSVANAATTIMFRTAANNTTVSGTERARIDSSGNLLVGKTALDSNTNGVEARADGTVAASVSGGIVMVVNRNTDDGTLVQFRQAGTNEGSISVSGTTVSYNGGHLSRWAQTTTAKDESLVKGTVLSNLDEMNVYVDAEGNPVQNEQLNKVKVSDVEGDANVAGVFVNWEHDEDHNVDEINMAMTGDMIIRIAQGVAVQRGDLLMSAGDGTAKPQGDDIVRAKTIAKVTSTHVTCTYADGSFCVPCVLMAC
jgi:hypothetical protein